MTLTRFRPSVVTASVPGIFMLLALCALALALKPVVLDGGDVFSPEAIQKADEVIGQIKHRLGKDLMIETYAAVPADQMAELTRKGKESFYADWITQRGRALRANGIMIIVIKDPGRLEVGVGKQTELKAFTVQDREELKALMTRAFQKRKFDDGLAQGVQFVLERMERNAGGTVAAGQGGPAARPSAVEAETGAGRVSAERGSSSEIDKPKETTAGSPVVPSTGPTTAPADDHHGADF